MVYVVYTTGGAFDLYSSHSTIHLIGMIALSILTGPAREVPKFARICKIRSHAPHIPVPRQADKEAAMRIFSFAGSSYLIYRLSLALKYLAG